jgi:hypothetical protein
MRRRRNPALKHGLKVNHTHPQHGCYLLCAKAGDVLAQLDGSMGEGRSTSVRLRPTTGATYGGSAHARSPRGCGSVAYTFQT